MRNAVDRSPQSLLEATARSSGSGQGDNAHRESGRLSVKGQNDPGRDTARAVPPGRTRESFYSLKRKAAPGVDGVTWQEYETGLEDRLTDLHGRVHRGAYRALPSRRVYIEKEDGRKRALGVAALEDKLVQYAVASSPSIFFQGTRCWLRRHSVCLGHSDLTTTEVYVRADPTEKLEAIEAVVPPSLRKGKFRPPDKLFARLRVKP